MMCLNLDFIYFSRLIIESHLTDKTQPVSKFSEKYSRSLILDPGIVKLAVVDHFLLFLWLFTETSILPYRTTPIFRTRSNIVLHLVWKASFLFHEGYTDVRNHLKNSSDLELSAREHRDSTYRNINRLFFLRKAQKFRIFKNKAH